MADIVPKKVRSRMMAGIKGKDTKPEVVIRKALHKKGFRYRLHLKALPGKPDLVLKKYKAVIFIHGCFWHLHDCHLFKWPSTRPKFWKEKISRNKFRDEEQIKALISTNWRVLLIWECAFKGKNKLPFHKIIEKTSTWIRSEVQFQEIQGTALDK
ncbi:MAG: very short patch repair endonuclease [Bacteroidia bacterium]|nr:very short patch repair endonuclease [Bacteroidia bacterium]